jgi:hypothetical protein
LSTEIYFVGTQYSTAALTAFPSNNPNETCDPTTGTNPNCTQIVVQSTQTTESRGGATFQPPLPVAITGKGFGFLPQPLPYTGPASSLTNSGRTTQFLTISDNGAGNGGTPWSTDPASPYYKSTCQIYVAKWNDSGIWLEVNLPTNVQDLDQIDNASLAGTFLSPLSDVTPLTFPASSACPVGATSSTVFDTLTFTVVNPLTSNSASGSAAVYPAGTTTLN